MILNGKAKEDFIKTKIGNEISLFESMLPIYSNALIIEWFDSVGICIDRDCINMEMVITDFKGIKEKQTIINAFISIPA
jgi:hypothetical protein